MIWLPQRLFENDAEYDAINQWSQWLHSIQHKSITIFADTNIMLEDAQPWQQDLWLEIIKAELMGTQPHYGKLRNFHAPALSSYSATTPELEKWFAAHNRNKPYCDRVRPFNFLLATPLSGGGSGAARLSSPGLGMRGKKFTFF